MCINDTHEDKGEHNMTLAHDLETEREFLNFQLHYGAFEAGSPYKPAKAMGITDTVVINIASYLHHNYEGEDWVDPELLKDII